MRSKSSLNKKQPISKGDVVSCAEKNGMITNELFFILDSSTAKIEGRGIFPKTFIYDSLGNLMAHLPCFATQISELKEFCKRNQQNS